MPNIVAVLKDEIRRLAKKEAKVATTPLRQASAWYRRQIARLKRDIRNQQRLIARLQSVRPASTAKAASDVEDDALAGTRFSARSVKAQRRRLGLSALAYGKLVGVSPLTIYNWEAGKARPRKAQLAALIAVRNIGKREAQQRLEESRSGRRARKPR